MSCARGWRNALVSLVLLWMRACAWVCSLKARQLNVTLILFDRFTAPGWSYGCIFCTPPFISFQLTTHKILIITFWFSFSSHVCIKFSPISLFLLTVSCSYTSLALLVHDKSQAACTRWPGVRAVDRKGETKKKSQLVWLYTVTRP